MEDITLRSKFSKKSQQINNHKDEEQTSDPENDETEKNEENCNCVVAFI
jgi:hypothetical protein